MGAGAFGDGSSPDDEDGTEAGDGAGMNSFAVWLDRHYTNREDMDKVLESLAANITEEINEKTTANKGLMANIVEAAVGRKFVRFFCLPIVCLSVFGYLLLFVCLCLACMTSVENSISGNVKIYVLQRVCLTVSLTLYLPVLSVYLSDCLMVYGKPLSVSVCHCFCLSV